MEKTSRVVGNASTTRRRRRIAGVITLVAVAFCLSAGSALAAIPTSLSVAPQWFTIEKLQKIAGSPGSLFTTEALEGEVGETVEYEIVVTNVSGSALEFTQVSDPNCSNLTPAEATELQPGEHETFSCERELTAPGNWSNQAEIETDKETRTSNEVVVEVPERRAIEVEKLQKIAGSAASYTKAELTGKVGQTVDYEIILANTGNVALKFSPLQDAYCSNLSPTGETEVQPSEAETFTCEHALTQVGEVWFNEVTVNGTGVSEDSNEVVAVVPEEPEFTITKLQQIEGSDTAFTTAELTAQLGQTIDYDIVVSNTGTRALVFSPLEDPNCTQVSPSGATELEAGANETFTCQHTLGALGTWANVASIEGALERSVESEIAVRASAAVGGGEGAAKRASSNQVVANVPGEPNFEIEKLQAIKGSGASATKDELSTGVGSTAAYEVIVRNTGGVAIKFAPLLDPNCTNVAPSGATELAAGASETFTCERSLDARGVYANEAGIEGAGKSKISNKVTIDVFEVSTGPAQLVKAVCSVSGSQFKLHGASGSKRSPFTVRVPSLGIAQITFYLDGRKLKTLKAAQARDGEFQIKVDPRGLRYGAHRITLKTVMSEATCPAIARSAVFVHARVKVVKPKFTG